METNHLPDPISLTYGHKDTHIHLNSNKRGKIFFFIAYNLDTGHIFTEASPESRKTELNALGYWVKFYNTPSETLKVRNTIRKCPWKAPSLLNIP